MKKIIFVLLAVALLAIPAGKAFCEGSSQGSSPAAQTRLDNGKRLFDQGNYDGAIQELNEAIRLDSNLAEAYAYRARSYIVDQVK